jgi:hypothetical protein
MEARDRWAASFYPHEPPLRVPDGIATARQNGQMAQTWWSARLVGALEAAGTPARMKHGRRYARSGQIVSLDVEPGLLGASVQGSHPTPYTVVLRPPALSPGALLRLEERLRSRIGFAAQLLAGELPRELADGPEAVVPRHWDELDARCSCPDEESPCKHQAAVVYIFAERIDADPWLLLEWLGCPRTGFLDLVAAPPATAAPVAPFWPLLPGRSAPIVSAPPAAPPGPGGNGAAAVPPPPPDLVPEAGERLRELYRRLAGGA